MEKQKKTFLTSVIMLIVLMTFTFALTLFVDCKRISIIEFVASPILVLASSSSVTIISIIIFLMIVGGIIECLNKCGFLEYMVNKIVYKYGNKPYHLVAILAFFLMCLGSLIGLFEEIVPLVPIIVSLAIDLGFDDLLGLGMSILAIGLGFASGLTNPFTVGVAQELAGLSIFSGLSLRLLCFGLIYVLLIFFLFKHGKRITRKNHVLIQNFVYEDKKDKALIVFVLVMLVGFVVVLFSSVFTFLQDYTIVVIALSFLIGGIFAINISGASFKEMFSIFVKGIVNIAPSVVLILLASSTKYIIEESGLIDVLLNRMSIVTNSMNKIEFVLFVYLVCLIMEFFIPSGSAKAFLLMPLIIPLASNFNVSKQLCVLAYVFGDGFSNVFYPTNPALIISLGLAKVDFKRWYKYTLWFQIVLLVLTSLILIFGLFVGY